MILNNRNHLRYLIAILFVFAVSSHAKAQDIAMKTNVLGDALGSLNLGVEGRVAEKWTIDLTGHLDPWTRKNGALKRHAFRSRRPDGGSATHSADTSLECTPMEASSMSEVSTQA